MARDFVALVCGLAGFALAFLGEVCFATVVGFFDVGNVFARTTDLNLGDLRTAAGVGLRYRSPIGPIRVDWGWKLSTRLLHTGGRERSNVVHISLGQAF